MRTRLVTTLVAGVTIIALAVLVGNLTSRTATADVTDIRVVDLGDVDISLGPTTVLGALDFTNSTKVPVTIDRVVSTCACTAADLGSRRVAPLQTLTVPVRMKVVHPGVNAQVVRIVLSSGHQTSYRIQARGYANEQLQLSGVERTISDDLAVRWLLVSSEEMTDGGFTLMTPEGAELIIDRITHIEKRDDNLGRLNRYLIESRLVSVPPLPSTASIRVRMRLPSGSIHEATVPLAQP